MFLRYDFDLRTGKSESGLKACTYAVEVKPDPVDGADIVWVETPEGGNNWRLIELQPVSEGNFQYSHNIYLIASIVEFADPPPPPTASTFSSDVVQVLPIDEDIVPLESAPKTLMQWAVLILNTANPTLKVCIFLNLWNRIIQQLVHKVERTKHAVNLFRTGKLTSIGNRASNAPRPPDAPPRDENYLRNTVADPRKLGKRKKAAVMLHALANIEQWA